VHAGSGALKYSLAYEKKVASEFFSADELVAFRRRTVKKEKKKNLRKHSEKEMAEEFGLTGDAAAPASATAAAAGVKKEQSTLDKLGLTDATSESDHGSRARKRGTAAAEMEISVRDADVRFSLVCLFSASLQ